ncbi:MAG: hypothetical protein ACJAZO_000243 [Myxococcota bacterium]
MVTVGIERLKLERSVYRRLLDARAAQGHESVVEDVLGMLLKMTGAERGFVQSIPLEGEPMVVAVAMAQDGVTDIFAAISSGIVGARRCSADYVGKARSSFLEEWQCAAKRHPSRSVCAHSSGSRSGLPAGR